MSQVAKRSRRVHRFRAWVARVGQSWFPRSYCCRELPFVHRCACETRKPVRLDVDLLEDRSPPGFFAAANPVPMAVGLNAVGLFSSDFQVLGAANVDSSWHSPVQISEVSKTSEVSTHGANAPRSGAENWTALSPSILDPLSSSLDSADFADLIALDAPFAPVRHSGASLSAGAFDDANLHSSVTDEGSSSGGGGSSGADVSSGAGGVSPLSQANALAGLVNSGPVISNNPAVNTPGSPANILLPPGVVPPSTPVANAPGSPLRALTQPGSPTVPVTTNYGQVTPQDKPGPGPNACLTDDSTTTTNVTIMNCGGPGTVFSMNQCPT